MTDVAFFLAATFAAGLQNAPPRPWLSGTEPSSRVSRDDGRAAG
ncbi:hypothetical protein [uncultured Ornithinimicrobium sp.]|nr:hypothetical protein [uncultured Ornithinimicrobium sp.]